MNMLCRARSCAQLVLLKKRRSVSSAEILLQKDSVAPNRSLSTDEVVQFNDHLILRN
jgi:hypothetical protein